MIRIYRRDFRAWLEKNQGRMVGDASNPRGCPLCRFLKSQGAKHINMQVTCRTVDGDRVSNSTWMQDFQTHAMRKQKDRKVESLRGREALEALEAVA